MLSPENSRITLGLLESVHRDGARSQRLFASDLGIALGLVNAYLKRCINKGLVKVRQAPARRYAYYLTPHGFAEKSKLTLEYLSLSFSFFREAKAACTELFEVARQCGYSRVVLFGVSDLAEIAMICSLEGGITVVAVIDPDSELVRFLGLPVETSFDSCASHFDAVVVTKLHPMPRTIEDLTGKFGSDRVLVPSLLDGSIGGRKKVAE